MLLGCNATLVQDETGDAPGTDADTPAANHTHTLDFFSGRACPHSDLSQSINQKVLEIQLSTKPSTYCLN